MDDGSINFYQQQQEGIHVIIHFTFYSYLRCGYARVLQRGAGVLRARNSCYKI
jgi:hypothetical protein